MSKNPNESAKLLEKVKLLFRDKLTLQRTKLIRLHLNILHAIFLAFISISATAQTNADIEGNWEFVNSKNGIHVYTRTPENSSFKQLRILFQFEGHIDTLMQYLNTAGTYTDWVYKCSESAAITAPEGFDYCYTATTDFPFPMSDRELVAKNRQWTDEHGTIHSHSICAADIIPEKPGIVRIPSYEAKWIIRPLKNGMIDIDYTSSVDPGGYIPSWVVNLAITAGPTKTFQKLIDCVSKHEAKKKK